MTKKTIYGLETALRAHVKRAALGGEGNDTPFEEIFGNLAHAYLQDKAPSLLPYEQGFQVVERNEDDTRALGVTGFKVNGMQLFSPVFCINGELKGHELLRLADQNIWVPLKEAWLNEIFRRKPIQIGSNAAKNTAGTTAPDLSELIELPTKHANYVPKRWHSVYRDIARQAKFDIPVKAASLARRLNPLNHLKHATYQGLRRTCRLIVEHPLIKAAFEQVHPGGLAKMQKELNRREVQFKSAALRMLPPSSHIKKADSVRFISYSVSVSGGPLPLGLSDKEKENLLRDGYLVQDDRKDSEVATVIDASDQKNKLFNPTHTGLYDVMFEPGKTKKMLVLRPNRTEEAGQVVVVDTSSRDYMVTPSMKVWCVKEHCPTSYVNWIHNLPTDLPGGDFMVIRGAAEAYGPIEKNTDGWRTPFEREPIYGPSSRENWSKTITRTPKGSAFRDTAYEIEIPRDAKILRLNRKCDTLVQNINPIDYMTSKANSQRVKESALRGLEPLKLVVKSGECRLNNGPAISTMEGFKQLVVRHGLREKMARHLLKKAEAQPMHTYKVYLKRAALETPPIPQIQDSPVDLLTSRLAAGKSGSQYSWLDSSDIESNPRMNVDSDYASQDAAAANQAIQSGQKDIFDVSILRSLYTVGDTDSMIDEQVGELTKAMTDAGDLLFRFYWKGDQFRELYGPKNLPELEGNIKKLFEILGDVVLFLKRNRLNQADYEELEPLNLRDNTK